MVNKMPIKALVRNLKDSAEFLNKTHRFSMAHEVETAIEYLGEQAIQIQELKLDLGLVKVALEQKETLLNSCEIALEREQFPQK